MPFKKGHPHYASRLGWQYVTSIEGFNKIVIDRRKRYEWYPIASIHGGKTIAAMRGKLIAASISLLEACSIALDEIGADNPHARHDTDGMWVLTDPGCKCARCKPMKSIIDAIESAGGSSILNRDDV